MERGNASLGVVKVKCEDFGQLFDMQRPDGNGETVKETASVFSVVLINALQHAFIRLVQGLW